LIEIIKISEELLTPSENGKIYPPQNKELHTIEYLFYKYLVNNNTYESKLSYLPVQWESIIDNQNFDTKSLNSLLDDIGKKEKKIFTISRLTGGPKVNINNCIMFTTGGIFNTPKKNNLSYVPLPLLASRYEDTPEVEKEYLASYIGRNTHPIRVDLNKKFKRDSKFYVKNLDSMDSDFDLINQQKYIETISKSYFSLCPRGFGPTSFRLYESIELGSVPVYISDDFLLPFSDIIDWEKICIFSNYKDIKNLKTKMVDILESKKYSEMIEYGRYCNKKYFNNDFIVQYILDFVSKY
tara:strand:+ start:922 stop:1809 length:888 start_codon:yes stop_codon:yes gene_type:complete